MPKLKNCRNCKWAKWDRKKNGRINLSGYAECVYPINVVLPLSRWLAERSLVKPASVWDRRNVPLDCKTWEAKPKETKNV